MGRHHEDQDSGEHVLVDDVVPDVDGVDADAQGQDVQDVGKNDCILGSIWGKERGRKINESLECR